ncbi:hypothetical protein FPV67DRAFT_1495892 [Lyophyllum atratum]|nr:hypothetical protein FPV67DRAFT_1495892 [Lyophyllum atratum]
MALNLFPEELLERILAQTLPSHADPRPIWLHSPAHPSTRLAPLLTSRQFVRIATPLLYHSVHIPNLAKAQLLLRTLRARPSLAGHIRCLSFAGVWREAAEIMSLCSGSLSVLDLTITFENDDGQSTTDELYSEALKGLTGIRHLTVRKTNHVYLSLPRPRALINGLAHAIHHWPHLRTAHIAFKLSDDTPTSPITGPSFSPFAFPSNTTSFPKTPATPGSGPVSLLAAALAAAPNLHAFTTHLPSVWNAAILAVSANPHLERIVLATPNANAGTSSGYGKGQGCGYGQGIIGTGLFLMEARRHQRLGELIRAGTPIIRTRAHTMGTPSPSPSPPPSSSSAPAVVGKKAGMEKRESGVGLGLRIDTGVTPGGSGSGSVSAVGGVCPSWLGRAGASAAGKGKGKGKGKGRGARV